VADGRALLVVLVVVALALAAALVWRSASGGGDDPADLDEHSARIQRLRRDGDVPGLVTEASNPDVRLATRAVEALAFAGPEALPHLERMIKDNAAREVRASAVAAFARAAKPGQTRPVARALRDDPSPGVRANAAVALGHMHACDEMETLLSAMDDVDKKVRRRAADAVHQITGVQFSFRAGDSPDRRRAAIDRIRLLWPHIEPRVRAHHARPRRDRGR